MTDEPRTPALVRCRHCGWLWPAFWSGIRLDRVPRSFDCPACGEAKEITMASKAEARAWADGRIPREPPHGRLHLDGIDEPAPTLRRKPKAA